MFFIGVAGGSGSGKTTFTSKILTRVAQLKNLDVADPESGVVVIHQDNYYLPSPPPHLRVHGEPNFDHPDAFDWALLRQHLSALREGRPIEVPVYDFRASRRTTETRKIGPCRTLILEGIFSLWDAEIRGLFDVKIFLNVDADIRFIRRLHRDVRERGRTLDGIIRQYYDTVRPMHHEFLDPTRQYADLIVGEETDIAAEILSAKLAQYH